MMLHNPFGMLELPERKEKISKRYVKNIQPNVWCYFYEPNYAKYNFTQ